MFITSPDTSPPAQLPMKQLEFSTVHSEQERADHGRPLPPSKGQFLWGRSSQREIQSGRARAQGGQGLMGLDRVSGGGRGPRDWAPQGAPRGCVSNRHARPPALLP